VIFLIGIKCRCEAVGGGSCPSRWGSPLPVCTQHCTHRVRQEEVQLLKAQRTRSFIEPQTAGTTLLGAVVEQTGEGAAAQVQA
jgi:hypothetical protein